MKACLQKNKLEEKITESTDAFSEYQTLIVAAKDSLDKTYYFALICSVNNIGTLLFDEKPYNVGFRVAHLLYHEQKLPPIEYDLPANFPKNLTAMEFGKPPKQVRDFRVLNREEHTKLHNGMRYEG
jgi:hypothetical protein